MIGCKCLHCGWSCVFPDKRTYVTCLRCRQLTVYKNEKQYLDFIKKQPVYVPVVDDSKLCECGCGQRGTVLTTNQAIRRYMPNHAATCKHHLSGGIVESTIKSNKRELEYQKMRRIKHRQWLEKHRKEKHSTRKI